MSKAYVRNQKDPGGTKFLAQEGQEDFEQERAIQEWLKREGRTSEFEYSAFTRKGTARGLCDKRSLRLDQKVSDERDAGTYADFIAGSDGRDLECRLDGDETEPEAREIIHGYLFALGFNEGEIKWLIKILKLSTAENKLLSERLITNLEW